MSRMERDPRRLLPHPWPACKTTLEPNILLNKDEGAGPLSFVAVKQKMPRATSAKKQTFLPRPAPAPPSLPLPAPSLGQSIKEGFGVGVGVAAAQRMMSGLFGAPKVQVEQQQPKTLTAYEQCLVESRGNVGVCAHLAESKPTN